METNKKTLKDYFKELLEIKAVASNPELVEFVNGRIAILDKKNSKSDSKPSKTQIENIEIKKSIVEKMIPQKQYRASEIAKIVEISPQKASALLTQLVNDKIITRVEDKKIAYFVKESE